MTLTIVVAVARNGVIGRDNGLPWHLPADLAFFRRTTMGRPVIMGRRTYQSIGRPLPGRHNIVVTGNPAYEVPGCTVVHSLESALAAAGSAPEVMLIGGASLFAQAMDRVDRIVLTEVDAEPEGDVFFPALDASNWREVWSECHEADDRNAHPYRFRILERRR